MSLGEKLAYSKKEYESIDPVELPAEITDAQITSGVGTDDVLITPTKLKTFVDTHGGTDVSLPAKYYHYLQLVCYPIHLSYPNHPLHKLQLFLH
jgi:hypothetical protein